MADPKLDAETSKKSMKTAYGHGVIGNPKRGLTFGDVFDEWFAEKFDSGQKKNKKKKLKTPKSGLRHVK